MQSQPQLNCIKDEGKGGRQQKSFSNRSQSHQLPPYSFEYSQAKQRAYERYKKYYPVNDKQNIYPLSKTPNIGYYLMKGYKNDPNGLRQSTPVNTIQTNNSSDKIVTHMLKRYLVRKENAIIRQINKLPKIDHSINISSQPSQNSNYFQLRKSDNARILTQCDETSKRRNVAGLRQL